MRTTLCAPPRLQLCLCPVGEVSVPFAGTFSRLGGCAVPWTAEAARRRHQFLQCRARAAAGWESDWRRATACCLTTKQH